MNTYRNLFLLFLSLWLFSCSKSDDSGTTEVDPVYSLAASPQTISFGREGGTQNVTVSSNYIWSVSASESWVQVSPLSGRGNSSISLKTLKNTLLSERTCTATISMTGVPDVKIEIKQEAGEFDPKTAEYIEPNSTGMSSNATALASKIQLGWNLVNTLEAIGGETAWGNPKATNELIASVKAAGFNAIRIPCSWNQYLEDQTSYKISETWMNRVNEVVDYCINNDMYVIVNIHWDGGWMENNCTTDKQDEVNQKLATIWKQIAIRFRDYDEHLLFAGANEPNADNLQKVDVLNVYMQTFVNTVRATGGRNTYRNLIIQAPFTDIDKANAYMTLPNDEQQHRLLAEVHYYSPYQFCLMGEDADWGKMFYFWGAPNHVAEASDRNPNWDCEENYVNTEFAKMKSKFADKGVPVILGEYGVIRRSLSNSTWQEKHNESRAYFFETITREAKNFGMVPFCWDNEIFNRNSNSVADSLSFKALIKGANNGNYPF